MGLSQGTVFTICFPLLITVVVVNDVCETDEVCVLRFLSAH